MAERGEGRKMTSITTGLRRRVLAGMIAAVMMGAALPAWSGVLSQPTGQINGRAPTATGTLGILNPEGAALNTAVVYQVDHTRKPTEFLPTLAGLTTSDLDGDVDGVGGPPTKAYQTFSSQTWTWRRVSDNKILTQAEQQLAFNQVAGNVNGTRYLVTAQVPVDIDTVTGVPRAQTLALITPQYTVEIKAPVVPTIQVNGANFTWAQATAGGFPKTAFTGANFQFYMGGTNATPNANYIYTTSQPGWTSVSPTGVVSITRMPSAAEKSVTITITDPSGLEGVRTYSFTSDTWFVNRNSWTLTASNADTYCAGLGDGYEVPSYTIMTNATRNTFGTRMTNGRLWSEWGGISVYGNSWYTGYWASEAYEDKRHMIYLGTSGYNAAFAPTLVTHVACSRSL